MFSTFALRFPSVILQRSLRAIIQTSRISQINLHTLVFNSQLRYFSNTPYRNAAVPLTPPARSAVLLYSPTQKDIEEQELDVEVIPSHIVKLHITDRAAEQLRAISRREQDPQSALRITVESGGCHGYQYKMVLAKGREPDDYQFSHPTINPSNVLVDAVSLTLLNGSMIDFATELIGSSFRVLNNPHAKGSSCGCGVSWELDLDKTTTRN